MDCDDVLEIKNEGTTMNVYRLLRRKHQVDGEDRYSLVRTIEDHETHTMTDAAMAMAYELVPEQKWKRFLYRTYWAREVDIIGEVSDGVMIWS